MSKIEEWLVEDKKNFCEPSISACAKGKRKSAGGYIWKYYGDVYG